MPHSRFDHAEIARSALNDMPEGARAAAMAEMLTELRGPQAIDHLSKVRAAVSLRMQELIDEKFPLHEMAAVYGEPAAVRVRMMAGVDLAPGADETGVWTRSAPRRFRFKSEAHQVAEPRQLEEPRHPEVLQSAVHTTSGAGALLRHHLRQQCRMRDQLRALRFARVEQGHAATLPDLEDKGSPSAHQIVSRPAREGGPQ